MRLIKKILSRIEGSEKGFEFEHRVFNALVFFIGLFLFIANIANSYMGLHEKVIQLGWVGWIFAIIIYYQSRVRKRFSNSLIIILTLLTSVLASVIYFYNAGSKGPLIHLIIMLMLILIMTASQQLQGFIGVFLSATILLLLVIEYFFPSLVVDYSSRNEKFLDLIITITYTLFFLFLSLVSFKNAYQKERETVLDQNRKLEEQQIKLEKQALELQDTLKITNDKTVFIESLFKELNHRVKNNLQIVISLLNLQLTKLSDTEARTALEDSKNRLNSIILLHQHLYQDQSNNVPMEKYLEELAIKLIDTYSYPGFQPTLKTDVQNLCLATEQAGAVGLIVNELICNAMKHAFNDGEEGPQICLTLKEDNEYKCLLEVKDNGVGIQQPMPKDSLGMELISILAKQLSGNIEFINSSGLTVRIQFNA